MGVKRFTDRWKWPYLSIFCQKNGVKVKFFLFFSKPDTAIVLVFILYDGSWTNNLSVVILRHNLAMHIF